MQLQSIMDVKVQLFSHGTFRVKLGGIDSFWKPWFLLRIEVIVCKTENERMKRDWLTHQNQPVLGILLKGSVPKGKGNRQ